jgi:hypothetical protein
MLKLSILAQADPLPLDLFQQAEQPTRILGLSPREFLLLAGTVIVLAAILFVWAWWVRRDPRRQRKAGERVLYRSEQRAEGKVRVRRKRSRHPENLPRNPTLAEAGGLPPAREEPTEPAC